MSWPNIENGAHVHASDRMSDQPCRDNLYEALKNGQVININIFFAERRRKFF